MPYPEQEKLGIVQHGKGVTVSMTEAQYHEFKCAMSDINELYRAEGVANSVLEGMLQDIKERGI